MLPSIPYILRAATSRPATPQKKHTAKWHYIVPSDERSSCSSKSLLYVCTYVQAYRTTASIACWSKQYTYKLATGLPCCFVLPLVPPAWPHPSSAIIPILLVAGKDGEGMGFVESTIERDTYATRQTLAHEGTELQ